MEAAPLEKAAAVLGEHWTVSANTQWLTVTAVRDDTPHVVRLLVEHDVDVFQVTMQRQSLEEYFLSVVREGVPDA